jgi:hypothetical protein
LDTLPPRFPDLLGLDFAALVLPDLDRAGLDAAGLDLGPLDLAGLGSATCDLAARDFATPAPVDTFGLVRLVFFVINLPERLAAIHQDRIVHSGPLATPCRTQGRSYNPPMFLDSRKELTV